MGLDLQRLDEDILQRLPPKARLIIEFWREKEGITEGMNDSELDIKNG